MPVQLMLVNAEVCILTKLALLQISFASIQLVTLEHVVKQVSIAELWQLSLCQI